MVIQVVIYLFARKQGFVSITNGFTAKLTCVFHCSTHSCFSPSFTGPTAVCLTVVLLLQLRSESAMLASACEAFIPHFEHFSVISLCVSCLGSLTQICFLRLPACLMTVLQVHGYVSTPVTYTDKTSHSRITDQSQCKALEWRANSLRGLTFDSRLFGGILLNNTDIHITHITAKHIDIAHTQVPFRVCVCNISRSHY